MRPASYDRLLADHQGLIWKIIRRFGPPSPDDTFQEINTNLVARWNKWDSERYKFSTWVWTVACNVIAAERRYSRAKSRSARLVSFDEYMSPATPPNQLDFAELSQALRRISGRDGEALLRLAMGDELADVADDFGVSRERARQLAARQRSKLGEAA